MRLLAENRRELDKLKLAFEAVLADPETDYRSLGNGRYAYSADQVKDIILYCYRTFWPDATVRQDGFQDVTLVDTAFAEYQAERQKTQLEK
ncbi:MAG: hypothetical protein K1X53_16845 [Candidatus Sumerlaeaceae bacterium]|nr:hypothetical protein [Candidatus Sumerlaeaceae bacterium]